MNLCYERLLSNMILIENINLFFFFFLLGVSIYITYQIKKCVYICECIIKKVRVCIYVCVCERERDCFDKYISITTQPPKQKFMASPQLGPPLTSFFHLPITTCHISSLYFFFFFCKKVCISSIFIVEKGLVVFANSSSHMGRGESSQKNMNQVSSNNSWSIIWD